MTMPETTVIADLQDACGEGPIWDPQSSTLRWVDITAEKLHTLRWPDQLVQTVQLGRPGSGLALTESADFVLAGGDGIWLWSETGRLTLIAREYQGTPLAVNDCIADPHGRLIVGTTFFDGSDTYPAGSLYAVEPDGSVRILDTGFGLANGMGFSLDGSRLYATDSVARRIYVYDYDEPTGKVSNRRVFVQVPSHQGLPDGLTVDAADHVWSAQWFGGCVCRYDPDGLLERRIAVRARQTSSLTFGGPDLTDIFITSAAVSDALSLAPSGYEPIGNIGGQLFHCNVGIAGKPEHRCTFRNASLRKESIVTHAPA